MTIDIAELKALLAKATPELLVANGSTIAKLLRAGAECQKPRAKDFDSINFDHDGVLISQALQSLPSLLDRLEAVEGEAIALRSSLKGLLYACYQADGAEELPDQIDGLLLDAASDALELQYPVIWTDEQVAMLDARQADSSLHPYTCGGDRSDQAHVWHADESGDEAGLLFPTVRGWRCPACDYRQFWSHETGGPAPQQKADTP